MKKGWELVIHEPSMRVILAARGKERTKLYRIFERLVENPYARSDFTETDDAGRPLSVLHGGVWAVTFWLDSFANEIRIVRIERITPE